jgi:hypothetical protein
MNVVRRPTVTDQCQATQLNALSQQLEKDHAISIGTKDEPSWDGPSCVASMSHVVWHADGDRTGQMCHTTHLIQNNHPGDAWGAPKSY